MLAVVDTPTGDTLSEFEWMLVGKVKWSTPIMCGELDQIVECTSVAFVRLPFVSGAGTGAGKYSGDNDVEYHTGSAAEALAASNAEGVPFE